jgi:hypothetical protein
MDRLPPLWRRATKRTAPLINSFTAPVKLTDVNSWRTPGHARPHASGFGHSESAVGRHHRCVRPGCSSRSLRVRGAGSRRVPCKPLDAPEDLPKQEPRQGLCPPLCPRSWGRYARNSATWGAAQQPRHEAWIPDQT